MFEDEDKDFSDKEEEDDDKDDKEDDKEIDIKWNIDTGGMTVGKMRATILSHGFVFPDKYNGHEWLYNVLSKKLDKNRYRIAKVFHHTRLKPLIISQWAKRHILPLKKIFKEMKKDPWYRAFFDWTKKFRPNLKQYVGDVLNTLTRGAVSTFVKTATREIRKAKYEEFDKRYFEILADHEFVTSLAKEHKKKLKNRYRPGPTLQTIAMRQVWKEKREEARKIIEEIQRDPDGADDSRLEAAQVKMLSAIGSIKKRFWIDVSFKWLDRGEPNERVILTLYYKKIFAKLVNRATRKLKEYNVIEKEWEMKIYRDEAINWEVPVKETEDAVAEEIMRKSDSEDSDEDEEDFLELSQTFKSKNKQSEDFANQFELIMKKRQRKMESQQSQMTQLSQLTKESQISRMSQLASSLGDSLPI